MRILTGTECAVSSSRALLLSAALRVFLTRGYHAATLDSR
jgi:AcrR family transcriptional regulator